MSVQIKQVNTKKELRQYIHLPAKIHKDHPNWIPPIYHEEWKYYNPKKNKTFAHSDTILFLAISDNIICGRIMGIINHKYNQQKNEKHARFCWLECDNDQEVAHALLSAVENWAIKKGMEKIIGPFGFSDKDPQGVLIEGFEYKVAITTNYNFSYLPGIIENEGYKKEVDCLSYHIIIPETLPDFYQKIYQRTISNPKLNIIEFRKKKELKPFIIPVLQQVNESFADIYGFSSLDEKEMDELAKKYVPLLDPRFVKVITDNNMQLLAFVIGIPNLGEGIIKSKGYLFPFGIFKILKASKRSEQLVLLLGATKKEYRGKGLDVLLGTKMIKTAQKAGITEIDSHLILENNHKMIAEVEKMGGKLYKRYRIYQKQLKSL
ncbi:hypothetical protein ACFLRZ_00930 [Bacteroidota bacterium]